MSFVQQLIKKFIKHEEKILLGRWNIDYCKNAINQKVDLSNEDHCGLCNQYRVIKKPIETDEKRFRVIDEFYF